jgi:putative peptidoglycan lipid II flippase
LPSPRGGAGPGREQPAGAVEDGLTGAGPWPGPRDAAGGGGRLAGNSLTVAGWTAVSRVTGFGRVAVTAAVLGPTYLGNIYQATNVIPNYLYAALTGPLFATLLVPPLVRHIDARDRRAQEELVGAFLGIALVAFAAVAILVLAAAPLLLRLLSLGVEDAEVAADQRRVGWLLLLMLLPQVLLYAVAFTAEAVMNAHGRFALAAAAPAVENLGIVATLLAVAVLFGTDTALQDVTMSQLWLLGLGTTAGVGLHTAVQCWGARRVGVRLIPRPGWRNPEVQAIVRRAVPSLGYSGLNSLRGFAPLIVANRVPGGVVAFELARNFAYLPVALGARPVAVALLPQLARLYHQHRLRAFRDELVQGTSLMLFVVVPAAVAYVALAWPLADAVAFGAMASAAGVALIAAAIGALGPSVLGESGFFVGTHASYARLDARSPFQAMVVRTGVVIVGLTVAFLFPNGPAVLVVLGLFISAADLVGALYLAGRLGRALPATGERVEPSLLRSLVASLLMAGPAYLVATGLPERLDGRFREQVGMLAAVLTGVVVFVGIQWLWRSPELRTLRSGFGRLKPGSGHEPT